MRFDTHHFKVDSRIAGESISGELFPNGNGNPPDFHGKLRANTFVLECLASFVRLPESNRF